jgi:hypothetical protein
VAPVAELAPHAPHAPQPFAYAEVDVQLAHAGPHAVPLPPPAPTPVPPLNHELRDGEFMEQRIERLERMLEDLLEGGAPSPKPEGGKKLKSSDQRGEWELEKSWEFKHDLQKELCAKPAAWRRNPNASPIPGKYGATSWTRSDRRWKRK